MSLYSANPFIWVIILRSKVLETTFTWFPHKAVRHRYNVSRVNVCFEDGRDPKTRYGRLKVVYPTRLCTTQMRRLRPPSPSFVPPTATSSTSIAHIYSLYTTWRRVHNNRVGNLIIGLRCAVSQTRACWRPSPSFGAMKLHSKSIGICMLPHPKSL